jgi:membrane fusion protein, multidrug efflux system
MKATSDTGEFRVGEPKTRAGGRIRVSGARLREAALALALAAGIAGGAEYGWHYWTVGRFLVTTDDAYVDAHSTLIAPHVSGYIVAVPVTDNETVRKGDVLARIDPRDYEAALAQARANVAAAEANTETLGRQIAQQKLVVVQDGEQVAADRAALVYAQQNFTRYTALARTGFGTVQAAQQSTADIRRQQAFLDRDSSAVAVQQKQIGVFEGQFSQAKAALAQQRAAEWQAELNLGYAVIRAPFDGTVGVLTATQGQYVQPGTQLMALVPLHRVYITANYKETDLTDVRPGQPATIAVDTYPGVTVHGRVEGLAPASGEEFALLPPDNATGNFTKIVQRIPVKIVVDRSDPLAGMLRPGMSVEPTIDTKPPEEAHAPAGS